MDGDMDADFHLFFMEGEDKVDFHVNREIQRLLPWSWFHMVDLENKGDSVIEFLDNFLKNSLTTNTLQFPMGGKSKFYQGPIY